MGFSSIVKDIKKAAERSWDAITNWLCRAFSLDSEQYRLSVMALFNRSTPVCWELMPLEGTTNWRSYIIMHAKLVVR